TIESGYDIRFIFQFRIDGSGEEMPFLPELYCHVFDALHGNRRLSCRIQRSMPLVPIDRVRSTICKITHRALNMFSTIIDHVERNEDRGRRIGPPEPKTDTPDTNDCTKTSQPVRSLHAGISIQRLVVNFTGNRRFHPSENDGWYAAIEKGCHHQPAAPYVISAYRHEADGRVLLVHKRQCVINEKIATYEKHCGRSHKIGNGNGAIKSERKAF